MLEPMTLATRSALFVGYEEAPVGISHAYIASACMQAGMNRIIRIRDKDNAVYQCQLNSVNGNPVEKGVKSMSKPKSKVEV